LILRPFHHSKLGFLNQALQSIIENLEEERNGRGQTPSEIDNDLRRIEVSPAHIFSDMRNFNLEPEIPGSIDYFSKPSFIPASTAQGMSVNKQYQKPNLISDESQSNQ
jgi:hypothetical protein